MLKNQVYKIREDKRTSSMISEYYYADDFYFDWNTREVMITVVGINIETLETAQMLDKFIMNEKTFEEVFYEEAVMNSQQIRDKADEIMEDELD